MAIVKVSPEFEMATPMSAQEIQHELVVHRYAQGKLSEGKARKLAEMDVIAFRVYWAPAEFLPMMG